MADRIDPAEVARLREQLAQHFALPLKAGRHHPDWAVGPVAKHRGDHVSWYFTDLTEEQAKATAALLNALPALLDAADAAEVLAHAVKGATAENEALRAEVDRLTARVTEQRGRVFALTDRIFALTDELAAAKEKLADAERERDVGYDALDVLMEREDRAKTELARERDDARAELAATKAKLAEVVQERDDAAKSAEYLAKRYNATSDELERERRVVEAADHLWRAIHDGNVHMSTPQANAAFSALAKALRDALASAAPAADRTESARVEAALASATSSQPAEAETGGRAPEGARPTSRGQARLDRAADRPRR